MNKIQCTQFVSSMIKEDFNENDEGINYLFSNYNINKDGLLLFEDFLKFFFDSIKKEINIVWDSLFFIRI